jgi:AraC-like DNA-binding protein
MEMTGLLDLFPLWTIFPISVAVALISVELGYRLAQSRQRRSQEEKEAPVGGMAGAALGLLAFMLAFTFGMASSRSEDRRQLMLSEANAIGTTYLRSKMLAEPVRTDAQNLIREYVDVRIEAVQTGKLQPAIIKSEDLQNRLWAVAVVQAAKEPNVITSLFIQSLNEVIDLHAARLMAAVRSRVPGVIWLVLYLLAVIAMLMMGYHAGLANSRRSIATIALVIGFSSVLYLIADLDRPGQGMLKVSQQSMIDVRKSMN